MSEVSNRENGSPTKDETSHAEGTNLAHDPDQNRDQSEHGEPVRTLHGFKVADIQPQIIETFGQTEKLPWIGVGMFLGALTILPLGKAFGIFNVKWLFLSVVTLFEIGSALCGAAPSMDAFIIGRVIQGIGACGCYTGAVTYVSLTTSKRERPRYLSGVIATWSVGSVIGPVVGGAFAQSTATWRWAFYMNLVFAAVTAPWLILYLPNIDPAAHLTFREKMLKQDWIGIIVFMGGSTCLSLALTFGGTVYPFNGATEIVLFVLSGLLLVVFLLVTLYHPAVTVEDRLYPMHFMKRLELNILQLAIFVAAGCMITTLYYTPLLFQFTRNDGPLTAGVRLLPFLGGMIFFSVLNGIFMPRLGYYMPWYVFGTAAILVGSALMAVVDVSKSQAYIYGSTLLLGSGCGAFFTAGFSVIQALVPVFESSDAISFMAVGQQLGFIVILSVAGTIFQNIGSDEISNILPDAPPTDIIQLTAGTHSAVFKSLSPSVQLQVVEQVTLAIRNVFLVMVAASALAFIVSLFLSRRKVY
ncbi:hypothetical protein N0V90_000439 [Kalmusia sp. IMI 367209]|nr:hypothetical protein N0V90_000439 [Kalmusia sp. IMI 367209]